MVALVLLALAVSSILCTESKTLSQKCSGWTPEDCSRVEGCMNCYDGFRVDCFPENTSQTYGSLWCESKAGKNNSCDGKDQDVCSSIEGCVYCESAAVGSQCYTTEEAKKLPAAIFSCLWPSWSSISSGPPSHSTHERRKHQS